MLSVVMEFQLKLFKILKQHAVKVLHSVQQQIQKPHHRSGKSQFPFKLQRKAIPKNVQTTIQLCSYHNQQGYAQNPSRQASEVCELRTSRCSSCIQKDRGTRNQIASICRITEEGREFQKNICFIECAKAFDCVDHNKLQKILKEMGIPDHLACLLRNLYAGQEATVRTGHGTTD